MSRPIWTTPADIRAELEKRWQRGQLLTETLADSGLFPLRLNLKQPTTAQLGADFAAARAWVESWQNADSRFFQIEWRDIRHRQLGRNQLPAAVLFATPADAAALLKKSGELARFIELSKTVPDGFDGLRAWLGKYPLRALEYADQWSRLLAVAGWISEHPRPGIYLRQISLPGVDTKFIEKHKKLLGEWLDFLLPEAAIERKHSAIGGFELRYGFLAKPQLIRFRLLDSHLRIGGLSDLTVTAEEFAGLDLPVRRVFVTENDINGLAFPSLDDAMVIFGRGYGFEALAKAEWLRGKEIDYWGDIDTHGFAILDQFRKLFPQTRSLLMDEATLLSHRAHWVTEAAPGKAELSHLRAEEAALYDGLRDNRFGSHVRLEQEYVGFACLLQAVGR
ncbi:DUF3322 domain-containing protein [Methylomonas sp. SURF-2]|uniref:DUF3322 domain-containing protein n=1 Tax=Methylomonas subterranea TaxID=2952225 RepID=A0ABT1TLC3_9GAMM|nr:DUF3322 domain-containing protein [Methylomonas sp. SURF-2]MCQ8105887.1 DUF3322 domain-containing protein [Methylomonas sp. SURF-2]